MRIDISKSWLAQESPLGEANFSRFFSSVTKRIRKWGGGVSVEQLSLRRLRFHISIKSFITNKNLLFVLEVGVA